jgi:hypothetical protein
MRSVRLLLLAVLATTVACSSVRQIDMRGVPKISLADQSKLKTLGKTIEEKGEVVLLVPGGTALRLDASARLPMAVLVPGKNLVRFTRDTYVYHSAKETLLSPDGERWAALGDTSAMRELYGFSGETLHLGFAATEERGCVFSVDVATK